MSLEATETQEQETGQSNSVDHTRGGTYFRPNVDICEFGNELVVLADIPGAKSDQIDIQFEDGALTIHAHVPNRQEGQGPFVRKEYGVGDFYRTFRVSEQIDASRISADYVGGVLTLHMPKVEAVKPRKIKVKSL